MTQWPSKARVIPEAIARNLVAANFPPPPHIFTSKPYFSVFTVALIIYKHSAYQKLDGPEGPVFTVKESLFVIKTLPVKEKNKNKIVVLKFPS